MPPFWKGDAETAAPDDRARALLARLQTHASHVYGSSEFYRRRFDDAGVDPGGLIDFEALALAPGRHQAGDHRRSEIGSPIRDHAWYPPR